MQIQSELSGLGGIKSISFVFLENPLCSSPVLLFVPSSRADFDSLRDRAAHPPEIRLAF